MSSSPVATAPELYIIGDCDHILTDLSCWAKNWLAVKININRIRKINSESGIVYNSLDEAKINKFKLFPSPVFISKEIKKFGLLKPFYVQKRNNDKDFNLISGQARFWAYQIAFKKKDSIPAIIIE